MIKLLDPPTANDYTGIVNKAPFPSATVEDLCAWAEDIKLRKPDVIIGDDYLFRWRVIPRNNFMNVYIHQTNHDDDDRALHDHPGDNVSLILSGSYREITPEGSFVRKPGDLIERKAADPHRLELIETCTSLFYMGPKYRNWGFYCPQGFVPWNQFVDPNDPTKSGPGCGD